jgi:hypothetical protein
MTELLQALSQFFVALWAVIVAAGGPLLPWLPLVAWVVFWLFAVNWVKLREVLASGGWIGVVLIGAVAVLIWGTIAPLPGGTRDVFGLHVSNFVEKTVYVSVLISIAFLAGSVQLSGGVCYCASCEPALDEDDHGHGSHGHDSHGHDDHGHHEPALPVVSAHH